MMDIAPTSSNKWKNLISLVVVGFVLLAIPVTVFVVLNNRDPRPKAEPGGSIRGQDGDLWADVVLGQRDFTESWPGWINPQRVSTPGGAVVERDTTGSTKGKAWIYSGGENRIVGVDLDNCPPVSGECTAVKVIGQPSLTDYGACNLDFSFQFYPNRVPASASTLCAVNESVLSTAEHLSYVGMYSKAGKLYVPDLSNHRVLIYYDPWNTDSVADEVIGQEDFAGNLCNKSATGGVDPTASSLCLGQRNDDSAQVGNRHGSGVALDNSGNLWVADSSNHRVVRFPKQADGKIANTADIVLGQPDFISGYLKAGSTLDKMKNPNSLRFDPSGNLYVSDNGNKRLLKFAVSEQKIGGTGTLFAGADDWTNVYIGEVDTTNSGIWLSGERPFNVALYGFDGALKKTINYSQRSVGSIGLAKDNSIVVTSPTQGTLVINNPLTKTTYDKQIFTASNASNNRLLNTGGIAISGNQLFASDNCRVMVWNDPTSATTGKAANFQIGQPSFNTCSTTFRSSKLAADNNYLYVRIREGVKIYQLPITSDNPTAFKTLTNNFATLSGGTTDLGFDYDALNDVQPQELGGQLYLWITDIAHSRVLRIRDPLGTPRVDMVLGQTNTSATDCNRGGALSLNTLCRAGSLAVDKSNNLYVADHSLEVEGNHRILIFSSASLVTGNTNVVGDIAAIKEFPNSVPHAAFDMGFDSKNHMVFGVNSYKNYRFIPYYLNPLDPAATNPDGYFEDFTSITFGVAFDSQDNLYVSDLNRGKIYIYKKPFVEPVGNQAPVVTITSHTNDTWYTGGTHKIKADINDDHKSVAKVDFFVDGKLANTDYLLPFETDYNFSNADGNHNITVKAYDQFQKMGQSSITIKIDHQGPGKDVLWLTPANGTGVSGRIPVAINADDIVSGAKRVDFFVDGVKVASDDQADSFGFWWDTSSVANGNHLLEAKAYDQPDNETKLAITVNVDNSAPVPPPSSPQLYLTPNSAGTYAEYNEQRLYPFSSTAQFEAFDEEVPDDIWSFVFTNVDNARFRTSGKIDSSKIPATATISSVEVFARAQNAFGSPNIKLLLRAAGVDHYSDPIAITNTGFDQYSKSWTTNPATGKAWTPADLADAEIGVQAWHATGNAHRVSTVWLVINYVTDLPVTTITSPVSGTTLKGNVNIVATAGSEEGIDKVEFLIDGAVKGSDNSAPYEYSWNTALESNNSHALSTKAYTPTGKSADSNKVNVVVDNAGPSVAFTNPTNGATISADLVDVAASVSDQSPINKVDFYVDGLLASSDTISPYGFSWTTPALNGIHQLTAVATDALGNLGSDSISVTINKDDTQKPTTPTLSGSVSGANVNLSWTAASDNKAVAGYYLYRNTVLIASKTASSLSHTDNPPCGSAQAYQVRAFDTSGNVSDPSNTVTLTVNCVDTQKPTAPTNLAATAVSSSQINLSWTAASDNVGVTNYEIYRNGTRVYTTGNVTSFADTGLTASTTYSYQVKAKDGAGNVSDPSNTAAATTQAIAGPGAIAGTVSSSSGGVIGGAKVTTSVNGSRVVAITDSAGYYVLAGLPAGGYSVKYAARQYTNQTLWVIVSSSKTTITDVTLQASGGSGRKK